MNSTRPLNRHAQLGATAVEFALIASAFFILLIGIMEVSRVLFYWNAATEATRLGARTAVVCDLNDSDIKNNMISLFPLLTAGDIAVNYLPAGCSAASCETITVSIVPGKSITTYIPFVPWTITMPEFSTTLPRESMQSAINGVANPICP